MHNNLCCDIQRGLFFMKIEQAIKEFLIEIEVRQFTPRTIKSYRNHLNTFRRFCVSIDVQDMEEVTLATVRQMTKVLTGKPKKGNLHQRDSQKLEILSSILL